MALGRGVGEAPEGSDLGEATGHGNDPIPLTAALDPHADSAAGVDGQEPPLGLHRA